MVTAGVELLTQVAPTLMVVEQQKLQQRKQSSGNRQRVYGQRRRVGLPLVAESHLDGAPTSTLPPVMTSFIFFGVPSEGDAATPPHCLHSNLLLCPRSDQQSTFDPAATCRVWTGVPEEPEAQNKSQ